MAKKDLISLANRTTDEQQNIAKKGGIASGKARREKRAMKQTLKELLSMPLKSDEIVDIKNIQSLSALNGKNITVQEAVMLAQIQKAIKGDTRAAEYIRDTSGNMINAESEARIARLKAETEKIKGGKQETVEDKVDRLLDAIGEALDAE